MKLVSNNVNEAVLSNVAEIGEFRIRNSAKAFSILSSGLYANKIKAIIRELSCNAFDSHVAAGKKDVPFDVHLPSALEPWFAIRDYGTGLDHDQVCNIYTTYFESTKTNSNDFIGALGLGSKSPFSYTDNFSVTAIKDGMKRIYSAFINEQGVPSIALLMEGSSKEPNGVEVKFSVETRSDFYKFEDEAHAVYRYFKLKPVVSGREFKFDTISYAMRDIIPGVHLANDRYESIAIMGNIAYPIDIPNSRENLGALQNLVNCGLHLEFDIGELDFQASREGLSYIPETIVAIKRKLELLNDNLEIFVANSVNTIENEWERAFALMEFQNSPLWTSAVSNYVSNNNFELLEKYGSTNRLNTFQISIASLEDYNIRIKAFGKSHGRSTIWTYTPSSNNAGETIWKIPVANNTYFVVNDGKTGIFQRSMNHFKSHNNPTMVFVINPVNPELPIDIDGFMKLLHNPPNVMKASELDKKPRKERNKTKLESILVLSSEYRWESAGTLDNTGTYYYLPLSGHRLVSKYVPLRSYDALTLARDLRAVASVAVYGVRKQDMSSIEGLSNWINLEDHIMTVLPTLVDQHIRTSMAELVDRKSYLQYNPELDKLIDSTSPYSIFINKFKNDSGPLTGSLHRLIEHYSIETDVKTKLGELRSEIDDMISRYPLLPNIKMWDVRPEDIAQYINAIDKFI